MHWFDWINLCRHLLQKLQVIHSQGVILGSLTLDSVCVRSHDGKLEPCIVDFSAASYNIDNRIASKEVLSRLPRSAQKLTDDPAEISVPKHVRSY